MPVVWTSLGFVAMIIFTLISLAIAAGTYGDDKKTKTKAQRAKIAVGAFFIVMACFNVLSVILTAMFTATDSRNFTAAEAATRMGFASGEAHPVVFGRTIDGSVGQGQFRLRYGSVEISPGSSVSFQYQVAPGTSCILEIPERDIDFKEVVGADPTLRIDLSQESYGRKSVTRQGARVAGGIVLDTLHLSTYYLYSYENAVSFTGCRDLSDVLNGSINRVTLTLSPEDHQKILKG